MLTHLGRVEHGAPLEARLHTHAHLPPLARRDMSILNHTYRMRIRWIYTIYRVDMMETRTLCVRR